MTDPILCPKCQDGPTGHRDWETAVARLGAPHAAAMLQNGELDCTAVDGDDEPRGPEPVAWDRFWLRDDHPEWLIEPLIPQGRLIALYSKGGRGKSLLALEVAAAAATGTPTLHRDDTQPIDVLYLDMEMTPDDLWERLLDYGYTEGTNLRHLHYYQLQAIPPLDTERGAETLLELTEKHRPALIVVDTLGRVTEGEENAADTYQDMYRLAFRPIKEQGISILRLDHEGKNSKRGQRGSSAKNDDVDVVWRLTTADYDNTVVLRCEKRRAGWIPDLVTLHRQQNPHLQHTIAATGLGPNIVKLVNAMSQMGIPDDMPRREVARRLREAGHSAKTADLNDAIRWRRQRGAAATLSEYPPSDASDTVSTEGTNKGTTGKDEVKNRGNRQTVGDTLGSLTETTKEPTREPQGTTDVQSALFQDPLKQQRKPDEGTTREPSNSTAILVPSPGPPIGVQREPSNLETPSVPLYQRTRSGSFIDLPADPRDIPGVIHTSATDDQPATWWIDYT